jgi:ankyrin repeat protein
MSAQNPSESMKTLARLIRAGDAEGIRALGRGDPELRRELNDPLPGGAFGATPLIVAAHQGNMTVVDALLEIGADIDGRSHWWAGSFGVLDGNPSIAAQMIERGATVDINAAAHLGMIDRVRQLLDDDASRVHHRGGDGQTPLHVAATVEIADLLLDRGADVNARDIDHESTAAQYATGDRVDVARRLVDRGSEVDILLACAIGDLDRVRKLVEADPRCVMTSVNEDWFPKNDPRSGGIIYIWTLGQHKTPQEVAGMRGHDAIVEFLQETSPAELNLLGACMTGDQMRVERILAENPDLKSSISTELLDRIVAAAVKNMTDVVRFMLGVGWPVNATDSQRATALHWAAFHGNLQMTKVLLEAGARTDAMDKTHGARPLGWATYGSLHGWHSGSGDYAGVVKLLLDAGATPPAELKDSDASPAVLAVLHRYRGDHG